jgi:hypothetical protein
LASFAVYVRHGDGGHLELDSHLPADEHAAALEGGVPADAPVHAVEGGVAFEADPVVAGRVGGGAGVLEVDGTGLVTSLIVRSPVTRYRAALVCSTAVETKRISG